MVKLALSCLKYKRMVQDLFLWMRLLAMVTITTEDMSFLASTVFLEHHLRAQHRPVGKLSILEKRRTPQLPMVVRESAALWTWAISRICWIDSVCFQFVFWKKAGAQPCKYISHEIDDSLWVWLFHCVQSTVGITTEAEQQLHHLAEGGIPRYEYCVSCSLECLAYSTLRSGDLTDMNSKYRRFGLFGHQRKSGLFMPSSRFRLLTKILINEIIEKFVSLGLIFSQWSYNSVSNIINRCVLERLGIHKLKKYIRMTIIN